MAVGGELESAHCEWRQHGLRVNRDSTNQGRLDAKNCVPDLAECVGRASWRGGKPSVRNPPSADAGTRLCPTCGSQIPGWLSACPNCGWDPDSLTERYRGTQWESQYGRGNSGGQPLPDLTRRSLLFARFGAVVVGVAAMVGVVVAINSRLVPDLTLDQSSGAVLGLVGALAAVQISLVVPGRMARGWFKGTYLVTLPLASVSLVSYWTTGTVPYFDPTSLGAVLSLITVYLVTALLLRLVLLFFERPQY